MDIRMPRLDGLAATELLRARRDPPEIIILTTFDTDDHIVRALRAGASGFLLKHTPPPEIVRAIRLVAAGEPMLSPTVTRRMMSYVADSHADLPRDQAGAALARLAERELAVAKLIAQGRRCARPLRWRRLVTSWCDSGGRPCRCGSGVRPAAPAPSGHR